MYAVVRTGGKQLRVSPGDVVKVEKLPQGTGETVELSDVLLVSSGEETTVGTPTVPNAKVICMSLGDGKGKKIVVYKYKRRKGYARKRGHRQEFTRLSIREIRVG
ncbi:MAG: 50S ribosomal protein L21, large subunit ribosomal protein L21 [Deltaproteobacteria bacterium CSP1-8]|nr:MAG: 50S ribosomal protein L21, large subunit ribosomal protein L21 [Deltaproteobacteria bacterium CSP1-8]